MQCFWKFVEIRSVKEVFNRVEIYNFVGLISHCQHVMQLEQFKVDYSLAFNRGFHMVILILSFVKNVEVPIQR